MLSYKSSAQSCIALCKESGGNTLLVYLMYKCTILESIVSGDASEYIVYLLSCRVDGRELTQNSRQGMLAPACRAGIDGYLSGDACAACRTFVPAMCICRS